MVSSEPESVLERHEDARSGRTPWYFGKIRAGSLWMSLISRRVEEAEKNRQVTRILCDSENGRIPGKAALMMMDLGICCSSIEIAATRRNETGVLPRTCLSGQARPKIRSEEDECQT